MNLFEKQQRTTSSCTYKYTHSQSKNTRKIPKKPINPSLASSKNPNSMDSNRTKRRSFSKSKLIKSIYRAAKPSAAAQPPYSTKPPKPTAANSSPAPPGAAAGPAVGFIIMNQEQIFPQPTPKVAFVVAADRNRGLLENFYGGAAEDEGVDAKAAKYISSVQERFRLERVNSERQNFQDILI